MAGGVVKRYVIERHWFEPDEFDANPRSKVVATTVSEAQAIAWLKASTPDAAAGEVMRLYVQHGDEFDGWDSEDAFLEWDGAEVVSYA